MSILDYPKPYQDLWAAHAALARLGFQSDDMFVAVNEVRSQPDVPGVNALHVRLETQGKRFVYSIVAVAPEKVHEVLNTWSAFLVELQTASDAELEQAWRASPMGNTMEFMALGVKLHERGFIIPAVRSQQARLAGHS